MLRNGCFKCGQREIVQGSLPSVAVGVANSYDNLSCLLPWVLSTARLPLILLAATNRCTVSPKEVVFLRSVRAKIFDGLINASHLYSLLHYLKCLRCVS